jgi:hypothetical protein
MPLPEDHEEALIKATMALHEAETALARAREEIREMRKAGRITGEAASTTWRRIGEAADTAQKAAAKLSRFI